MGLRAAHRPRAHRRPQRRRARRRLADPLREQPRAARPEAPPDVAGADRPRRAPARHSLEHLPEASHPRHRRAAGPRGLARRVSLARHLPPQRRHASSTSSRATRSSSAVSTLRASTSSAARLRRAADRRQRRRHLGVCEAVPCPEPLAGRTKTAALSSPTTASSSRRSDSAVPVTEVTTAVVAAARRRRAAWLAAGPELAESGAARARRQPGSSGALARGARPLGVRRTPPGARSLHAPHHREPLGLPSALFCALAFMLAFGARLGPARAPHPSRAPPLEPRVRQLDGRIRRGKVALPATSPPSTSSASSASSCCRRATP